MVETDLVMAILPIIEEYGINTLTTIALIWAVYKMNKVVSNNTKTIEAIKRFLYKHGYKDE